MSTSESSIPKSSSVKNMDWHKKNNRRIRAHNGKKYKINFNKRPIDLKIKKFKATQAAVSPNLVAAPPTLDLRPYLLPVKDQGENGDCVAFSTACTKEYQEYVVNDTLTPLSAWFIYTNANVDAPMSCDTGLDITQGFDIIKNMGVSPELHYPTPKTCPKDMPVAIPQNALDNAKKYKIHSYNEIGSINELKTALANFGPCPIGFPVYNYTSTFWEKKSGDILQGGHCVSVVGYTDESFIIRNSWGSSWANEGYTFWPFTSWGNHLELYSANNLTGATVAPSITKKILVNPTPAPTKNPTDPTPAPTQTPTQKPSIITPTITTDSKGTSVENTSSNSNKLSTGAIVGIVIGTIIGIPLFIYLAIMLYLYISKKK
jgi:C1A family cysteine protease